MGSEIPITGGVTLVSPEDLEAVARRRWQKDPGGYAARIDYSSGRPRKQYLHRMLLGEPDGYVDHLNRDRLDNRRENLRVTTNSLNMLNAGPRRNNRSGHPGVCISRNGKWRAYINVDYKQVWLGTFVRIEDAIRARKQAEGRVDPERCHANS